MRKFLTIFLSGLLLTGCASPQSNYARADMTGYESLKDTDHVFYDISVNDMVEGMDAHKTFVVYFGFAQCPWCQEAVPVLNAVAKENQMQIGYINTRKDPSWSSNMDIDDYDHVTERLGDYLEYDDDGIKHLYTPHVFFIREGKVVDEHEGAVPIEDESRTELNAYEKEELKDIYQEGFEELK